MIRWRSILEKPSPTDNVRRSIGGEICDGLKRLLDGKWSGLFGGAHLLPFFTAIDGADAGFDPVDHREVDRRLGDWRDVRALGEHQEVVADLIVNHISRESLHFRDFSQMGGASAFAGLFLDLRPRRPFGSARAGSYMYLSPASRVTVYKSNSEVRRR